MTTTTALCEITYTYTVTFDPPIDQTTTMGSRLRVHWASVIISPPVSPGDAMDISSAFYGHWLEGEGNLHPYYRDETRLAPPTSFCLDVERDTLEVHRRLQAGAGHQPA